MVFGRTVQSFHWQVHHGDHHNSQRSDMCIHKSWNGVGDGICGLSGDYNIRLCLGDEPNNTAVLFCRCHRERECWNNQIRLSLRSLSNNTFKAATVPTMAPPKASSPTTPFEIVATVFLQYGLLDASWAPHGCQRGTLYVERVRTG